MSCYRPEDAATATPAASADALDHNPYALMQPRMPVRPPKEARNGARVIANHVAPQGVYLPNNNVLTPYMRSPEYVQMSTAAAITLGIMKGRMYRCSCTRCLNLLLTYPEGCRANCAYCGLARHREAERDYADRNFIRVDWPAVPLAQTIDIVARDGAATPFHRMCISMITHPRSDDDTVTVLKAWTDRIDPSTVPVSILSNPDDDAARGRAAPEAISAPTSSPSRSTPRRPRSSTARAARACSRRTAGATTGRSSKTRATSSDRRNSARTSSWAWARPSTTRCPWSSGWSTWAGTATCSASSPRRAR